MRISRAVSETFGDIAECAGGTGAERCGCMPASFAVPERFAGSDSFVTAGRPPPQILRTEEPLHSGGRYGIRRMFCFTKQPAVSVRDELSAGFHAEQEVN